MSLHLTLFAAPRSTGDAPMRNMDVKIVKLNATDAALFSQLVDVFADAFEMEAFAKPPDAYLGELLAKDSMIVFVAMSGETVIGGLTAYVLPSPYAETSEIYVYDLAVATIHQRSGVGATLMRGIREYAASIGAREVFLQADYVDEHAVSFYHKLGGAREDVIHFSFATESVKMPS